MKTINRIGIVKMVVGLLLAARHSAQAVDFDGGLIQNGSFENTVPAYSGGWSYLSSGLTFVDWVYTGGAGICTPGSPWVASGNSSLIDGTYLAYIQGDAALSQTVTVSTAGSYSLAFLTCRRPGFGTHYLAVTMDGGGVTNIAVTWETLAELSFQLNLDAGSHVLSFGRYQDNGDTAAALESVRLTLLVASSGTLTIRGDPAGLGSVVPAYGVTNGFSQGDSFDCSAPETAENSTASTLYACAGHVLETYGEEGWESPVTNNASSFTYTQGEGAYRLTWLWKPIAYKLTVAPVGGFETVTPSVAPDTNGYYTAGTEVTLTPNGATSPVSTFVRWTGDVPAGHEADNPLTVAMDQPLTITPVFSRSWVYFDDSKITDGDWCLNVSGSTELTVTGVATNGASGLVDLTTPISNGGVVTAFNGASFQHNTNITALVMGDSTTSVGGYAFAECTSLTQIQFSGTLTTIGTGAFEGCYALAAGVSFPLGGHVTELPAYAFKGCAKIASVDLAGVTSIGDQVFYGCASLTNVVLSVSLTSIGGQAFFSCSSLTNVTPLLPASLVYLGGGAFQYCSSLTGGLTITNPAVSLSGTSHFEGSKLTSATLGTEVTSVPSWMFNGCSQLGAVAFSPSLTSIGDQSFGECSSLTNVTPFLPASLVYLGGGAFHRCSSLVGDLSIASSVAVTFSGTSQFEGSKLTSVTLGTGVASLPSWMFNDCAQLTRFWFCGDTPSFNGYWLGVWTPGNYQVRCYVPKGYATWQAYAASDVTALTESEEASFIESYPSEKLPVGTWVPTGGARQWYCTWVPPQDQHNGTLMYLK